LELELKERLVELGDLLVGKTGRIVEGLEGVGSSVELYCGTVSGALL
jgi:hypothetical protein